MPYFPHTPEALLGRNDSKNAATTCKGVTSSGRACRRALASPSARRRSSQSGIGGVVALVQEDGQIQEADFYCWQHKDQAEEILQNENKTQRGGRMKRRSTELFPLQERTSIDTLVQRLGIDSTEQANAKPERRTRNPKAPRKTETNDFVGPQPGSAPYGEKYKLASSSKPQPKRKKQGFWASLCCIGESDDDYVEIVRHKRRTEHSRPPETSPVQTSSKTFHTSSEPACASVPIRKPVVAAKPRPNSQQSPSSNSQTNQLLSLIPPNLSPQTTSTLLTELTKPISPYDEEGYIYIFWLTPQSKSAPPESTARLLLSPSSPARAQHTRRISDVMTEFSYEGGDEAPRSAKGEKKKTIMLKIGRANNITRRMNEWQRQCGYALNLVRWYPYIPSTSTPSPSLYPDLSHRQSSDVHKVPCVKRVERLIHLELAERQVKRQCVACGKEHREWFEVEASQAGVRGVDETVRRWVGWAEKLGEVG